MNSNNRSGDNLSQDSSLPGLGELLGRIVRSSTLQGEVEDIVEAALAVNMDLDNFRSSLVFSGVALGVSKAQESFHNSAVEVVQSLRRSITVIDSTILACNDEDSIKAMDGLRKTFQEALKGRSRIILGMYMDHIEKEFGLTPATVEDKFTMEDCVAMNMSKFGFTCYTRQPSYFISWHRIATVDAADAMQCQCMKCTGDTVAQRFGDRMLDGDAYLKRVSENTGSLDALFSRFGTYVMTGIMSTRQNIMEGTDSAAHMGAENSDALSGTLAQFMTSMRGETGPVKRSK